MSTLIDRETGQFSEKESRNLLTLVSAIIYFLREKL